MNERKKRANKQKANKQLKFFYSVLINAFLKLEFFLGSEIFLLIFICCLLGKNSIKRE